MHAEHSQLSGNYVEMNCKGNIMVIPIRREQAKLKIVYNYFVSTQEKKEVGPHIWSVMAYFNLYTLDLFGDLQTSKGIISGKNGLKIWSRMSMNITLSFVVRVLVQVKTKTCLMPRRIFCYGTGDG